jgi:hypothetical protein
MSPVVFACLLLLGAARPATALPIVVDVDNFCCRALAVDAMAGLAPGISVGVAHFDVPESMFVGSSGDLRVPPMTWSPSRDGIDLMFRTYVDCASGSCLASTPVFETSEPPVIAVLAFGILCVLLGKGADVKDLVLKVKRYIQR